MTDTADVATTFQALGDPTGEGSSIGSLAAMRR